MQSIKGNGMYTQYDFDFCSKKLRVSIVSEGVPFIEHLVG